MLCFLSFAGLGAGSRPNCTAAVWPACLVFAVSRGGFRALLAWPAPRRGVGAENVRIALRALKRESGPVSDSQPFLPVHVQDAGGAAGGFYHLGFGEGFAPCGDPWPAAALPVRALPGTEVLNGEGAGFAGVHRRGRRCRVYGHG